MVKSEIWAVLVSLGVIILAAVVQHKSRYLAGLISVMPLKVIAVMWIVWIASRDADATAQLTLGMLSGVVATGLFLVATAFLLRAGVGFYSALGIGLVLWILIALTPKLLDWSA